MLSNANMKFVTTSPASLIQNQTILASQLLSLTAVICKQP